MLALPLSSCSGESPQSPADTELSTSSQPVAHGAATGTDNGHVDPRLLAFAGEIYEALIEQSPLMAARIGVEQAGDRWDDLSEAAAERQRRFLERSRERLHREFDRDAMNPRTRLQHDVLREELELRLDREHTWRDHVYPLNQIVGLHLDVANTLINRHRVRSASDAEAYVARLRRVEPLFEQLVERMKAHEAAGVLMPAPVYPRLIGGVERLVSGAPFDDDEDNPIWQDFNRKLDEAGLDAQLHDRLLGEARDALLGPFRRGYLALRDRLVEEASRTTVDGGAWQLPDGERYYEFAVRLFTTTDLTPDEIHEQGLHHVERLHGEIAEIMRAVGFDGDLGEFFEFMREDDRFYYADTDEGRAAYLERARELTAAIAARMDEIVTEPPRTPLEVRRFEAYREHSAPRGMSEPGASDGSRPGVTYLNLSNMRDAPVYALDALLFHEGIPGHHLQKALINEDPEIPQLRKIDIWWLYGAHVEGWALYAEYLPREMGFYEDPYADFGRLSMELWRAVRLVVDTGLHARRWTREEAIDYMVENSPASREGSAREIDRYLVVPGQATGFMIGMQEILALRERAREALGEDFDIRRFHEVTLEHGYLPLWALGEAVDQWIDDFRATGESER